MKINSKFQSSDSDSKFDYLNFLYSIGAVIILIGVIAKLLEWEVQDFFMTLGLSTEAVVFAISSVKYIKSQKQVETQNDNTEALETPEIDKTDFETYSQSDEIVNSRLIPETFLEYPPQFGQTPDAYKYLEQPNLMNSITPDILWQLDEIGIISFPKDIFYRPEWLTLSDEKYNIVAQLFLDLFGKKTIPKKYITVLKSYNIRLPESGIGDLVIENPRQISPDSLHILLSAFNPFSFKSFFDQFIVYAESDVIYIRSSNHKEIQIFGGESSNTLLYCSKFYPDHFTISPNVDFLAPCIKFKNEILLDHLIKHLDINNHEAFDLMTKIIFHKKDATKLYFIESLKPTIINDSNSISFQYAKSIVTLLLSFNNKTTAKNMLNKLIVFSFNGNNEFHFNELVNVKESTISISDSVSFQLKEIFDEQYLDNCNKVHDFVNKLINEKFIDESYINDFFELSKMDTLKEVYKKHIQYLDKYEIIPNPKQISFSLECKNVLK
jgi:hypothetical protein